MDIMTIKSIDQLVNNFILPQMEKSGISRYQLSKEMGMHESSIKRFLERDMDMKADNVLKLCKVLKISISAKAR